MSPGSHWIAEEKQHVSLAAKPVLFKDYSPPASLVTTVYINYYPFQVVKGNGSRNSTFSAPASFPSKPAPDMQNAFLTLPPRALLPTPSLWTGLLQFPLIACILPSVCCVWGFWTRWPISQICGSRAIPSIPTLCLRSEVLSVSFSRFLRIGILYSILAFNSHRKSIMVKQSVWL